MLMSLAWDIDIQDAAAAASSPGAAAVLSPPPPVAPSSKSFGSGGGNGKLVKLVCVRREGVCLGYIGEGRVKMCVATDCDKTKHRYDKYSFPEETSELIFIGSGGLQSAWVEPSVDLAKFGPTWERYRDEVRTVASWQTFINALLSGPTSMSEDEVVKIGTATMRGRELFTPHKKQKTKVVDSSPTDSERSFENINYIPLRSEEDPSTQWTAVAINLSWLHKMALSAKRGRNELEDTLSEEVTNLEARIGELKAVMGERPSKLGTATSFSCIMEHYSLFKEVDESFAFVRAKITDMESQSPAEALRSGVITELQSILNPILEDLRLRMGSMEGKSNQSGDLEDLDTRLGVLENKPVVSVAGVAGTVKADLYVELSAALAPLRQLFGKWSSQMQTPGDKLDLQLSMLGARLLRLETMVQQASPQGNNGITSPPPSLN
jgi:hypothetical protein